MDKCREEFEKWFEETHDAIITTQFKKEGERYLDRNVRRSFESWQHQQAKVDELQKQLSEYIFVAETLDEMYVKEVQKSDDLQKRVDKAIRLLVEAELYQSEPNIDLAVKALKGEG
ncbi:hypothetical protein ACOCHT_15975 [Acinetobacter baumannii]